VAPRRSGLEEDSVKRRYVAAIAVIAALIIAGCSSSGGGTKQQATGGSKTLTVWLMDGSAPKQLVADLNSEFQSSHPGVTVNYQVQQWNGIQDKLTTSLASNAPPDVIELGNTQSAKFAASGGLMDLSSKATDLGNSGWLKGMTESGQWDGKQFAVPFYSANRFVVYRTDLFKKAGITAAPTSIQEWIQDGEKLAAANKGNSKFVPLYLPGQAWYVLASMIWDNGGQLAVKSGDKWQGTLDTPQSMAGIRSYEEIYKAISKAPADTDEATPQQFEVFAKGNVGMMIGLPWEANSVLGANKALKGKIGTFPIPSHTAGQTAPVFLGGSDLAIPAASANQSQAYDWVKLMLSEKYQTRLAKENGAIPATASLGESVLGNDPLLGSMVKSSSNGQITPNDPTWAAVEAGANPLKDMMTKILSGKASVDQAAKEASGLITEKMASGG
jgi:N,N'-diacetylchitobiose transport system substrate-binding protein